MSDKDFLKKVLRESSIDRESLAIIESHLDNSERLKVIRDAFLEGKDADAVMLIKQLDETRFNRTILGINSTVLIGPSTYQTITVRPQLPFKVNRFLVSRRSSQFMIQGMAVGVRHQFVAGSDVAADLFEADEAIHNVTVERSGETIQIVINKKVESRIGIAIDMPVCSPGEDLVVHVRNDYPHPAMFHGAFLGSRVHDSRWE